MKKFIFLLASWITLSPVAHADPEQPLSVGWHDDSEAGIVLTGGNSSSQSFNFRQLNTYIWELNTLKFSGKYLNNSANDLNTARYWALGLRYERGLTERLSVFAGEGVESDVFSGYVQRYNTDVGGKYFIFREAAFYWDMEAGYRYTLENRFTGQAEIHFLRFFTEANREWTKTFSTKAYLEYLPNLTTSTDYQVNAGLSMSAAINEVFSIKASYDLKYRNLLITPAIYNTDTQFTTALVAKI